MRIYTKTGDKGKTSLGNGDRIFKSSSIIETLGTIDELNCFLGLFLSQQKIGDDIVSLLTQAQNDLFDIGADLCMIKNKPFTLSCFKDYEVRIQLLEEKIDFYDANLPPLKTFILPGGTISSSFLHCARSIARRSERTVCALFDEKQEEGLYPIMRYLNRLSDLLFVLARFLNNCGKDDILWNSKK